MSKKCWTRCCQRVERFMELLLEKQDVEDREMSKEDVLGVEAVYVGNRVRGLVRVKVMDG